MVAAKMPATTTPTKTGGSKLVAMLGSASSGSSRSTFAWSSSSYYYLVFIIFAICFYLLYRVVKSSFGRALVGVRENEPRMISLGYNTWLLKYMAIIIGGVFAGIAGMLYAYYYGAMVPTTMAIETSASVMLMVIIGGPGTLFGPVIGSVLVVLIEHFASLFVPERWPLILGGIFVLSVMLVRGGFAQHLSRYWRKTRPRGLGGTTDS